MEVGRLGYGELLEPAEVFPGIGKPELYWGLGMTGKCLRLGARFGGGSRAVEGAAEGQFFEGLWEGDVVEFFIAGGEGKSYLEFNLAPNGSWWACGFSDVREREVDFQIPPVSAHGGETVELWIDTRGLPFELAGARGNVTSIVGGEFFSVARLGGEQPDFHRPEDFVDLLVR